MIKLVITKEKSTNTYSTKDNEEIVFSTEIPEPVLYKLIGDIAKTVDDALGPRTENK